MKDFTDSKQFGMFFNEESWLRIAKCLPKDSVEKFHIVKSLGFGICISCNAELGYCGKNGIPNFCPECGHDNMKTLLELGYI